MLEELRKKYDIELYSDISGDYEDRGVESFKSGNYKEASEDFERVIVAIPDHFNGWEMASYSIYMEDKEDSRGIKYLVKAIEIAKGFEGLAKIEDEVIMAMESNLEAMENKQELDMKYVEEIME